MKLNAGQKTLYLINFAVIVFVGVAVLFSGCPKNDVTSCLLNDSWMLLSLALVAIFLATILFGKEGAAKDTSTFTIKKWAYWVQLTIVLIVAAEFFYEFVKRPFSGWLLIFGTIFLAVVLVYNLYKLIKS